MATNQFHFTVIERQFQIPASGTNAGFLIVDHWNDWFEFTTMYLLVLYDSSGQKHEIGQVKIGQFGMQKGQARPSIPSEFAQLGDEFFSLGQDESYYSAISSLDDAARKQVVSALHDVVADVDLFRRILAERVTTVSLLRNVSPQTVEGQFRRVLLGGARLTRYKFAYTAPRPLIGKDAPPIFTFEVVPDSHPPTNIHVLIGRNGVGKTFALNRMVKALLETNAPARRVGQFEFDASADASRFSNLVSITFSAFDPFEALPEQKDRTTDIKYFYIGLKRPTNTDEMEEVAKGLGMLAAEFVDAMEVCIATSQKLVRWRRALEILDADPIFKAAEAALLAEIEDEAERRKAALRIFRRISSGHRIVLLSLTRLVETVEEATLVLIDEPETHLHPPLLAAFIRALSDLLTDRNGVAILATHSPVVLQEVPKNCVWKLRRSGAVLNIERPEIETFGENVGTLTQEVFRLEVTQSGYHKLLNEAVEGANTFEDIVNRFDGELGGEALAIARALLAARDSSGTNNKG
jgi:ABC-type transport system involved in cytochrome c biogenesis ATPase subunit